MDQLKKERLIDIYTMRLDGHTFQEIGEKYRVSRQCVEQELKESLRQRGFKTKRYPTRSAVASYLDDRHMSVRAFSIICEVSEPNMKSFLYGRASSRKTINSIIKATGLTYEQIMAEELQ